MSTLSANRLPASPIDSYMTMSWNEDFIIRTTSTGIALTFDVIAHNLVGKSVELSLWRTADLQDKNVFPPPAPAAALDSESFTLVDGYQPHTFTLPLSKLTGLVGAQAKEVTLLLHCPSRAHRVFSGSFKLEQPTKCGFQIPLQRVFQTKQGNKKEPYYKPYAQYGGSDTLWANRYQHWDRLVVAGLATYHDRIVIGAVGRVEGKLDAVQGYDSEVVSAGCIQKTVKVDGSGELPEQLWNFKQAEPTRWSCLMGNAQAGWDVQQTTTKKGNVVYYVSYADPTTAPLVTYGVGTQFAKSLSDLRDKIHEIHYDQFMNARVAEDRYTNRILDHFVRLGRDEAYQELQLRDAISRLKTAQAVIPHRVDRTNPKTPYPTIDPDPKFRYTYAAGQYLRSYIGQAYLLSESVNRPNHVPFYLGSALDEFFNDLPWDTAGMPAAPGPDPSAWSTAPDTTRNPAYTISQRYEQELIKLYAGSLENTLHVWARNEEGKIAVSVLGGTTRERYGPIRRFFEKSMHDVSWLPKKPRAAEVKRKK